MFQEQIPKLDVSMEALSKMTYQETAYTVMKQFLTDFSEEELKDCIRKAYDSKFDNRGDCAYCESGRRVLSGIVPWSNDRI